MATNYPANPFEAPRAGAAAPARPGSLDIGTALKDGWEATKRNFGQWLVTAIVFGIVGLVATLTFFGFFLVVPVLYWGYVLFMIKAVDGEAQLGDLFAGFSKYGQALGSMLGFFVLDALLTIPGNIINWVGQAIGGDSGGILIGIGSLVYLAWFFLVLLRFSYAPFYIVDQGIGPVEALKASWHVTSAQKLNIVLLFIVGILIVIVGLIALIIGVIPAGMVFSGMIASAYRQLSGTGAGGGGGPARSAF